MKEKNNQDEISSNESYIKISPTTFLNATEESKTPEKKRIKNTQIIGIGIPEHKIQFGGSKKKITFRQNKKFSPKGINKKKSNIKN